MPKSREDRHVRGAWGSINGLKGAPRGHGPRRRRGAKACTGETGKAGEPPTAWHPMGGFRNPRRDHETESTCKGGQVRQADLVTINIRIVSHFCRPAYQSPDSLFEESNFRAG